MRHDELADIADELVARHYADAAARTTGRDGPGYVRDTRTLAKHLARARRQLMRAARHVHEEWDGRADNGHAIGESLTYAGKRLTHVLEQAGFRLAGDGRLSQATSTGAGADPHTHDMRELVGELERPLAIMAMILAQEEQPWFSGNARRGRTMANVRAAWLGTVQALGQEGFTLHMPRIGHALTDADYDSIDCIDVVAQPDDDDDGDDDGDTAEHRNGNGPVITEVIRGGLHHGPHVIWDAQVTCAR